MANSKYAYVRSFELPDPVLPNTYMVVRIDGKGFHEFSAQHGFAKPNDGPALELMNEAARHVLQELKGQVVLAFGESDEYSFLFSKTCALYNRRESKIVTHVVSLFTGAYIFHWPRFMPNTPLQRPPSFDGRLVMYPSAKEVRDYFSWRQVDTHINNLYNTTFWALIQQGGMTEHQANEELRHTISAQKHEILYARFQINYDRLPQMYRKGTTLVWESMPPSPSAASSSQAQEGPSMISPKPARRDAAAAKPRKVLRTLHVDIIGDSFWTQPAELTPKTGDGLQGEAGGSASGEVAEEGKGAQQPWDDEARLQGDGLGASLLV
ncbi:tRNA-His guanylyltransferase [Tilletia horrida]|nr:tRNA-His guanylyltransferase [Tilletia horrida]